MTCSNSRPIGVMETSHRSASPQSDSIVEGTSELAANPVSLGQSGFPPFPSSAGLLPKEYIHSITSAPLETFKKLSRYFQLLLFRFKAQEIHRLNNSTGLDSSNPVTEKRFQYTNTVHHDCRPSVLSRSQLLFVPCLLSIPLELTCDPCKGFRILKNLP